MDSGFDFTNDEIRDELQKLGYVNVPDRYLEEFKRDLEALVLSERSSETGRDTDNETTTNNTQMARPHMTFGDVRDTVRYPSSSANQGSESRQWDPVNREGAGVRSRSAAGSVGQGSRQIKRKVRHRNGEISESVTGSEADDMSYIEERLAALSADVHDDDDFFASRRPITGGVTRLPGSAAAPHNVSDVSLYGRESVTSRTSRPKSVIQTRTRTHTRTDPVSAYQRYRQGWETQQAPGERAHKDLRWAIREKMIYHDTVVEKKAHNYRPNSYIVPTEKKRKSLRWQIREDLAQGIVRPSSVIEYY